jgi:hypothetical protein
MESFHKKWLITLTIIELSGFHCTTSSDNVSGFKIKELVEGSFFETRRL